MKKLLHIGAGVIFALGFLAFSFFGDRSDFVTVALGYSLLFLGYAGCCFVFRRQDFRQIVVWAVLVRLMMFAFPPGLSDDVYRFLWDGRLTAAGYNPMELLPDEARQLPNAERIGLTNDLWEKLNSKQYHTVYPPLHQAFFAAAAFYFPHNEKAAITVMRVLLLLVEVLGFIAIAALSGRLDVKPVHLSLYALNPLVIVEGIGNLHFEIAVVGLLLLALWAALRANRMGWTVAGSLFGLAVLLKLTPLMLGPLLLAAIPVRRWVFFFGSALVLQAVGWSFFITPEALEHFMGSLDLYFRRFEFNASLYYIARAIGTLLYGYNPIAVVGPAMAVGTTLAILTIAVWYRFTSSRNGVAALAAAATTTWLAYLLFATTVHPWYTIVPLAFALHTHFRWGLLVWSFTVLWSYAHYHGGVFSEHLLLIALSYALPVAVHIYFSRIKATA